MYGEDIDLSYRIVLGGYKNYYYPATKIIHYKGESTKKSSVNYVFVFYNAMIIFAKKHFSAKNAKTFSVLIKLAIYLRAFIALINRFVYKTTIPIIDYTASTGLLFIIAFYYQKIKPVELDFSLLKVALPVYSLVWFISMFLSGVYDKPVKIIKILKGGVFGALLILVVYGLLPKSVQFSRLIIILGTFSTIGSYLLIRLFLHVLKIKGFNLSSEVKKRFAVVGSLKEAKRVQDLLGQTSSVAYLATISPDSLTSKGYDGSINQLEDFIHINKINEVVFCAKDLTAQEIIHQMSSVSIEDNVDFKIAQPDSLFLIGSNSIHTSGDIYLLDLNNITKAINRRNKRLFDFFSSLLCISLFPVLIFLQKRPFEFILNCFKVLLGKKTWVGFNKNMHQFKLPKIKEGVLFVSNESQTVESIQKLNLIYAKDYSVTFDFKLMLKNIRYLGS
jgi:hypothetical protein